MEQVVQALEGVVTLDVPPVPTSLQAFAEDDAGCLSTRTYLTEDDFTDQQSS
uniref:Uncharacterized protein n=1 Tax=Arundo donax TaxID=35708 RepID=A0A0A9CCW7_ARUDO